MPLRFRIEYTKKSGPRIAVVREILQANGKSKTEQIGSISARKVPELLLPKLKDDEELLEFNSYISQLKFNKFHFNAEADNLDRIIIRISAKAKEKITALAILCHKAGIPFLPGDIMLNSLLKRSMAAEVKLNAKLGKKVNLLESLGIRLPEMILPNEADMERTKPFKALLQLNKSPDEICDDFTAIARRYKKTTHFKPIYFNYYAGLLENKNQTKPSKWFYGVAIELLHQYQVDPFTIVPPEKAAEYWGWLQKGLLSSSKATALFLETFKCHQKIKQAVTQGIRKAYGIPEEDSLS